MQDTLLTTEDVAKRLKVSVATVKLWVKDGEIPSFKLGALRRFRLAEIEEWIDELQEEQSYGTSD